MITYRSLVGSFLMDTGFEMRSRSSLRSAQDLLLCNPAGRGSVGKYPVDREISRMAVGRLCSNPARPNHKCR